MNRKNDRKKKPRRAAVRAPAKDGLARRSEQRERLLHAAQRAIHRAGPQISMDEIAAEAGITKPIFYRHFGDRRGLARALRDSAVGRMLGVPEEGPASTREAARERVAALYPVVADLDDLRRVVVGFAMGFQMFVELNRNLYRFLRAEGVFESLWDDPEPAAEPVAASIASSLRVIYAEHGIDEVTAQVWAAGLRGMVREVVDGSTASPACDRFELERQLDLLTRTVLEGLGQALARPSFASKSRTAKSRPVKPRTAKPRPAKSRTPKSRESRPRRSAATAPVKTRKPRPRRS